MAPLHRQAAEVAAAADGVLALDELARLGFSASTRSYWIRTGKLVRLGPRSFVLAGTPPTWRQRVRAATVDLGGRGLVAGRSAARLHGLDGFHAAEQVELLVDRAQRGTRSTHRFCSTSDPLRPGDVVSLDGLRGASAERLIVDAPLFGFRRAEIENAIDSAIRLRLADEQRLRSRVAERSSSHQRNSRGLVDALVDSGGESHLERRFLALLRAAGLPRPVTQRVFRSGSRLIARVDAIFPDEALVVELAGHATHSSRRQRQLDEQRRTELTLAGQRVITFTYDDLDERPSWVVTTVGAALTVPAEWVRPRRRFVAGSESTNQS